MRADTDAHELPDLGRQLSDYSTSPSLNNQGILQGTLRGLSPSKVASNVLSSLKPDLFRARKPVLRPVPTAWLDGLRGVAAFVVCVSHLTGYVYFNTGLCYGHETDPGQIYRSPIGLPFIRILFSGQYYAVVLFFMISGYVLTKRLIALLHQGRREEFLEALNSSVCRRPGRLWLPVIWSTFALAVFWHATGIVTPFPPREPTFIKELWNWKRETLTFMDPFRAGFMLWTNFNYHTWTIPVELRGSMLLYVWLFATSQFSARTRVLLTLVVLWYYVYGIDGVFYASFFAGYIIAECDLIYAENIGSIAKLPWDGLIQALRRRPKLKQIVLHGLLITGLFLSGQPYTQFHDREVVMNQCGVWSILNKMIPVAYEIPEWAPPLLRGMTPLSWRWFWFFWAAWLTVFSCNNINWVKKLFESAPAQYLGKHSFALYLLHGPLIALVSERLLFLAGVKTSFGDAELEAKFGHLQNKWLDMKFWPFPAVGPDGLSPNFLFVLVTSLIVFLYCAEMGTKLLDRPSVAFSRWCYNQLKATPKA